MRNILRGEKQSSRITARIDQCFQRHSVIIHHYCPHTFNAGDHFVTHSIRRHLSSLIPNAVFIPRAIAVNRGWGAPQRLRGPNIAFSNRYADAVVVGGSDNYRNWSLRIDAEEIQQLKPPLFLLGLGVSSNDLNESPLMEKKAYLRDILAANRKAAVSTVRDEATALFLKELGITNAVMTGCPALFLESSTGVAAREDGPLLLTFPFPVNRKSLPRRFAVLQKLIADIAAHNGNVVLSCHDDRDVGPATESFPGLPVFFSNDWHDYVDLYRSARMVVGSRLHGSILAGSMGVPFININVDIRGQSFSRTFGLESWNPDYDIPDLSDQVQDRIEAVKHGDTAAYIPFQERRKELEPLFHRSMERTAHAIKERIDGCTTI